MFRPLQLSVLSSNRVPVSRKQNLRIASFLPPVANSKGRHTLSPVVPFCGFQFWRPNMMIDHRWSAPVIAIGKKHSDLSPHLVCIVVGHGRHGIQD
jgi:hypothetical protein